MKIDLIVRKNTGYSVDMKQNILVIGVFHGDEPVGEFLINQYLKIQSQPLKNDIYYIPRLNWENKRTNINGVDLNRNFPTKNWQSIPEGAPKDEYFGGVSPGSEVEVKFIMDLMNKVSFDAIVTIHTPYKIINYDSSTNPQAQKLANEISKITGYPVEADIGYPTPGSFGTYSGVERNIPTITIEADEEIDPNELLPNFEKLFNYLENEY